MSLAHEMRERETWEQFGRVHAKVVNMRYALTVTAGFVFSLGVYEGNTPRGIYRASEVPGSPLLLASGLAWSDAGLVIADRKEKRHTFRSRLPTGPEFVYNSLMKPQCRPERRARCLSQSNWRCPAI